MTYHKLSQEQGVRIKNSIKSQKKNLYEVAKKMGNWDPSKLSRVLKGYTGIYEHEAHELYEIVNDSSLSFLLDTPITPSLPEERDIRWRMLYDSTVTELRETYLQNTNPTRALIISDLEKIIEKYKVQEDS